MTPAYRYPNLALRQRTIQWFVDAFNADEAVWRELENRRRFRCRLMRLTKKERKALAVLEFATKRPPDDCIGSDPNLYSPCGYREEPKVNNRAPRKRA